MIQIQIENKFEFKYENKFEFEVRKFAISTVRYKGEKDDDSYLGCFIE